MELICGACQGRFMVQTPGTTVACPHCGVHVEAPSAPSESPETTADVSQMFEIEDDPHRVADATKDTLFLRAEDLTNLAQDSQSVLETFAANFPADQASPVVDPTTNLIVGESTEESTEANPDLADFGLAENTASSPNSPSSETESSISSSTFGAPFADAASSSETISPVAPFIADVPRTEQRSSGVSRTAFMIVLSYASAMTLACGYLIYERRMNPGTLDLPDMAPPVQKSKGKVVKLIFPEDRPVPAPNTLRLGESRQYGSLRVTPLKVTRGPIEFRYYNDEADQHRDPEGPVLKLHVRFENVSKDQEFVPLDSVIVFSKDRDPKTHETFRSENFVSQVSDRGIRAKHAYAFDLLPQGVWLIRDQNLDKELAPGETLETFIPTGKDGLETLEGDLLWRFHFRKGYNPTSFRGVTTLIEVLFNSSEIEQEEEPTPPVDKSKDRDA